MAFKNALNVWIEKPHVLHKKLFGARKHESSSLFARVIYPKFCSHLDPFIEEITSDGDTVHFFSDHAKYSISFEQNAVCVTSMYVDDSNLFTADWFSACLQPKLQYWIDMSVSPSPNSLSLIDLDMYQRNYARLKSKHAPTLLNMWCEKTDPDKFIHEDLGIAAYLLCIWADFKDVRFVDIGCGNGLLVYLLVSEGFTGLGVDIRRRTIWEKYPNHISNVLKEETVDPSTHLGFSEANWLIGNHSDELTPWLPIMARNSNPNCRIFMIPCCPFSLFQKFDLGLYTHQEQNEIYSKLISSNSLTSSPDIAANQDVSFIDADYWHGRCRQYIRYLQQVVRICGFEAELDILRIPSTKRFCIVGRQELSNSTHEQIRFRIKSLIDLESSATSTSNSLIAKFVARSREMAEQIPNLTDSARKFICLMIFRHILALPVDVDFQKAELKLFTSPSDGRLLTIDRRWWNPGGRLSIEKASSLLDASVLSKLKLVKGGLQTLLRNQHQAFIVTKNCISLRYDASRLCPLDPRSAPTAWCSANERRKTKPCWMAANHPDGCPYSADFCDFLHPIELLQSGTDLQSSPPS